MSNKRIPQIHEDAIEIYIDKFNLYGKEYKYIGKDKDGLFLYDYLPNYDKERNVFSILNEKYISYISNSEYNTNVEEDILGLFKDGEIILIEDGIERIKSLMNNTNNNVNKLFKLLSEVQGVEIKPYDIFEIKNADDTTLGSYYLDENFRRYYHNGIREHNEDSLRGILTGEMKILKCKKAVVLTEDDIICLKYYLKNGYRYIANETTEDLEGKQQRLKLFKEKPIYNKRDVTYRDVWEHYINKINTTKDTDWTIVKDELSFEHYYYPEIWDIEELLEQERVSHD